MAAALIPAFVPRALLFGTAILAGAAYLARRRAAPSAPVLLRPAVEEDLHALAVLYAYAVHSLGPDFYSPAQVEAWARFADEPEGFRRFVMGAHTLVAERDGEVVGFGGVDDTGHIVSLYVDPQGGRQGIGKTLLDALIAWADEQGITELRTEASELSRALFAGHGFSVEEEESVERAGVPLTRYRMVRGAPA
jgi:putative acetyltransferase